MTVPLGNTPSGQDTPEPLKKEGLLWMGNPANNGGTPVIVFYRTISFPQPFAPKPQNIDALTGRPRLVDPVEVDLYFPNGPLQGQVFRRVQFIGAGWTRPIRATAPGSINVGQLAVGEGQNGPYPQLNGLDQDALAWASQIHQAAGGDVFAYYSGQPSAPVQQVAPAAPQAPVNRFEGVPTPVAGSAQQAPQGMPGMGGPPPGFAAPAAQAPAPALQGPPPGFAAPAAQAAPQGPPPGMGQPSPIGGPPPNGVPVIGQPPAGPPSWAMQGQA